MTPERWRELDEAERMYRGLQTLWEDWVLTLDEDVMRALIDAARPKCQRCLRWSMDHGVSAHPECLDCKGTGWAA